MHEEAEDVAADEDFGEPGAAQEEGFVAVDHEDDAPEFHVDGGCEEGRRGIGRRRLRGRCSRLFRLRGVSGYGEENGVVAKRKVDRGLTNATNDEGDHEPGA